MAIRILALPLLVSALLAPALLVRSQEPPAASPHRAHAPHPDPVARGDALHEQFRPLEALALFEEVLAADPAHYPALWRSARESVTLGMLASGADDARRWYLKAEGYARRAVESGGGRVEGHQWLAIALGRRALSEGPQTRVRMAEEVRAAALQVLQVDPSNAGGHHVLGQWNAEIMRLSGVSRFLARRVLGGSSFDRASWEAAVEHLSRAVELAPEGLIHHLELGRVYLDLGERERARAAFREVMDRPAVEPVDPLLKQQALALLRGI